MAQVALRYTVNANLIFKWLRDPKYRPAPGTGSEEAGLRFLPVEIVAEARAPAAVPVADSSIEIELAGGHRIRISGGYDPEALAWLTLGDLEAMAVNAISRWIVMQSERLHRQDWPQDDPIATLLLG